VSGAGRRFAIPQVNVSELIRIPAAQVGSRIDHAGDRPVLLLRDRLVPLVHLREVLSMDREDGPASSGNAWHVVLVDTGATRYGLVVDALHDTVEIVVKPLGRHLQGLGDYAGATILGDGRVALILDVAGIASRAGLRDGMEHTLAAAEEKAAGETHALLLFENAPGEPCALPIEYVTRVERVMPEEIQYLGGRRSWKSGAGILPVLALSDGTGLAPLEMGQQWVVIVFEQRGKSFGLLAAEPLDLIDTEMRVDTETLRQHGIAGSLLIRDRATVLVDLSELVGGAGRPAEVTGNAYTDQPGEEVTAPPVAGSKGTVLVAEDSDFFRSQICRLVEAVGYQTLSAPDGRLGVAGPERAPGGPCGDRCGNAAARWHWADAEDPRGRPLRGAACDCP
jgi:two-component system, chemotaxis family, sensor kinase CheA